jgi:hypothetical protein
MIRLPPLRRVVPVVGVSLGDAELALRFSQVMRLYGRVLSTVLTGVGRRLEFPERHTDAVDAAASAATPVCISQKLGHDLLLLARHT